MLGGGLFGFTVSGPLENPRSTTPSSPARLPLWICARPRSDGAHAGLAAAISAAQTSGDDTLLIHLKKTKDTAQGRTEFDILASSCGPPLLDRPDST